HVVAAVFAALDRLLVHQFDDVEHLNRSRSFSQHLEDVDALDLHQLVRRTGVAAEKALGGWELRALASRHESPEARASRGRDLLVAEAGAVLAPADAVLGETLGAKPDYGGVFLGNLVLAGVAHEAEHRRDGMFAIGVRAGALAIAVDVGAEVSGDVAVLGQAAINEGRRLIILRGDDRGIVMRQTVVELVHRDRPDDAT